MAPSWHPDNLSVWQLRDDVEKENSPSESSGASLSGLSTCRRGAFVRLFASSKFSRAPKYNAEAIAAIMQAKHVNPRTGKIVNTFSKRRKIEHDPVWREGSNEEVLAFEVEELLKRPRPSAISIQTEKVDDGDQDAPDANVSTDDKSTEFHEIQLDIEELSSTGDGLARSALGDHVYAIPFTVPGDTVLARVRRNPPFRSSSGDFVKVIQPASKREGVTPDCKYFSVCSGCQFQMLPYPEQLAHKRTIVEKAFRKFSDLPPESFPPVEETGASPLQYGYRTKLTPHFDGPGRREKGFHSVPAIGFTKKGFKRVMDIEACPIGTPIVQEGLKLERAKVATNISKYKNGATILLRETTERIPNEGENVSCTTFNPSPKTSLPALPAPSTTSLQLLPQGPQYTYTYPSLPYYDIKGYVSDNNALSTEYLSSSSLQFTTRAGSFFQNNNSILPSFLTHLRSVALPAPTSLKRQPPLRYLLDAYCGSGLLSLALAPLFASVLGIEIDGTSVIGATDNAKLNNITNCGFIEADAADLFADVPFPPSQTVLVIDPPRKGCSVGFLKQMLKWGPQRVVYVSCNVHSQARDVGWMCRGGLSPGGGLERGLAELDKEYSAVGGGGREKGRAKEETGVMWRYQVESLKGWDFFPQTGHVEGLCVLNRVEREEPQKEEVRGGTEEEVKKTKDAPPKREITPTRGGSRSPKRQATSSSKKALSIWEAVKDEVEVKAKEKEEKEK